MSVPLVDRPAHHEVLASLVPLPGLRVVDVGCGAGALVRWLRGQGAEVIGVECGPVMMALAREADPDHVGDYREGEGQDLPLADDSVDLVVFSYSLHHVPSDQMVAALREAHRVLRAGGTLYVVEPLAAGPAHEVVSIVADETEVRALAQAALDQAAAVGFVDRAELLYTSRTAAESAEAYAENIVGVDPTRAERMNRYRAEFTERFEALATRIDGKYAFDQENRVRVFAKALGGALTPSLGLELEEVVAQLLVGVVPAH
jgi:ubiquinone/menaquinone biosynthesis C-methylase UbiE